nr:hypothetical protein [Tanacetum cinerariifolium]
MINLTTFSLSFWDYALETAIRILKMVSTKKVDKTPCDLWNGKVSNLSYIKVWRCEALVKRDRPDKLQQRSVKCIFIRYPKEMMGYYLYFPSEDKIVVVREVKGFKPPQDEVISVRRSERTHQAPERLLSNKWLDAINAKMQSMKDNQVWCLVDLSPNGKTVGSKWLFKKKTDMDGNVHTYKARLVAKGFFDPNHPRKVCKLQRSMYGLKQALRSWNKRFDEEVKKFIFAQIRDEPCVYQKASESNVTFCILYVDDIIIMGNYIPSLQNVKTYLGKCFAMKDLGKATFILGINICLDKSKRLIGLSQSAYMDKILKGSRWIISSVNPGGPHWTAVKTILKYLRNTKDMFLVYDKNPEAELRVACYCNAGFEADRDEIKSQTGYVFILNERRKPMKEDVSTIPVWVKLYGIHVPAFSEDGLSAIATKLGTPLMFDSYTSDMCMQSWGRSSYARVMIELRAYVELKDTIIVAMPKITREGHYTCNVCVEYG